MNNKSNKKIIFLASGKDFHALDWYRTISNICLQRDVLFATDIIESEGQEKIIKNTDNVINLFNIDRFLFSKQTFYGNKWRNFIKLLFIPIQILKIKALKKRHPNAIFHAHTMYYMFISWLSNIDYIGSPQGDEILIRPFQSKLYKYFSSKALKAANNLIVDSVNLQNGIKTLSQKNAHVIQYGIDVSAIKSYNNNNSKRTDIVSIRALYPLYRIKEIIKARNNSLIKSALIFFYPYWEETYKDQVDKLLNPLDKNLGRLPTKNEMYQILSKCYMAISIPESDSSPRSVYEAIFSGCCAVVTYNPWIESLPICMRSRVYVIDINDCNWFVKAEFNAKMITETPYIPSEAALDMFDQEVSMKKVVNKYYI